MGYPHPSHPRETPVLSQHFGEPAARTLTGWRDRGGYVALEKALKMDPAEIQTVVKDSGLRGRGGAGFPTGVKWSFMKPDGKQHYLCCNADESEPGTFKDREIMRWTPHALVEGVALAAHAIYASTAYIYIRGEFTEPLEHVRAAVKEAYAAGVIGENAMGTGKTVHVHVHQGAGAFTVGSSVITIADGSDGRGPTRAAARRGHRHARREGRRQGPPPGLRADGCTSASWPTTGWCATCAPPSATASGGWSSNRRSTSRRGA